MARTQATIEEIRTPEEPVLAAESTDRQESSEQPDQKPSAIGFFEQISRFSPADWEQHIVYVYRLSPITDRLAGGTTKYLMKYGSRFDQDTMKADHGSGRYRLQLNKLGERGQSKTIRSYELDIEDINFPPKVPPGEWLDDPRNKRWAWARKKEDAAAAALNAGSTGESWTPERVLKLVRDLRPDVPQNDQMSITKAVLDAVKETRAELGAANNPASMITTLKELILIAKPAESEKHVALDPLDILTKAKALFGDNSNSKTDAVVVLLTEQLKASREDAAAARESAEKERQRNHELQLKMMETKANAADPMDMIEKVLNIKERLGGDEPDQRNWKEKLVDQGMQYVPQLLDVAGKIAGGYRRQEPANPQRTQQQQPAAPASTQPQAVQTPTQPQPTAPAGEQMPPPEPIQPLDPEIAFLLPIFERFGARLVAAFRDDPNSGGEVAGAVRTPLLAGRADYERICRMGREKILATIELIPQMKTDCLAAGTPAMLNDFIDDFIAGPDEDADDDGEEDPELIDPIGPDAKREKKVTA